MQTVSPTPAARPHCEDSVKPAGQLGNLKLTQVSWRNERSDHFGDTSAAPPGRDPGLRSGDLSQACQFLQDVPVLEAVLLRSQQQFRRISVLVEVLRKPTLAAAEVDEIDHLSRL